MSRRAGHLQGSVCSVLQPTHLIHGRLRFRSLLCLIWAGEGPSYQASTARFLWRNCRLPKKQQTKRPLWLHSAHISSGGLVMAAPYAPRLLHGCTFLHGSCAVRGGKRVQDQTPKCSSWDWLRVTPTAHPSPCTIISQHKREMAQPCRHKCIGAL